MNEIINKKCDDHTISKELQEAIERCKRAQLERKKRQQQYCINRYYEKKRESKKY